MTWGIGLWRGMTTVLKVGRRGDPTTRRKMEAFITRLKGLEGTFYAPVNRPSQGDLADSVKLFVSSASITSDGYCTVSVTGKPAGSDGLVEGDYVSIDDRLYHLVTDQAGVHLKMLPAYLPPSSEVVTWRDVTCVARLTERSADELPDYDADFAGPWVLDWLEDV